MNQTIAISYKQRKLEGIFYRSNTSGSRGCIFYFHGGGLVFGSSRDLPAPYRNLFQQAGFDLLSLAYPLAPETSLCDILDASRTWVEHIAAHPELCGYDTMPPYALFGRSAGAFLALNIAHRIRASKKEGIRMPSCVLSFYGYHTFLLPEFSRPAAAYTRLPAVPEAVVNRLIQSEAVTEGDLQTRYSIYIYARQQGTWTRFLGTTEEITSSCLSEEDLKELPPCFFTASSADQDVPFRESKYMVAHVPGSIFKPVYYLEHDFDRDTSRKEGMQVYRDALVWMDPLFPMSIPRPF